MGRRATVSGGRSWKRNSRGGVEQGLISRMNDDRCDYVPLLCFAIMCCSKGG